MNQESRITNHGRAAIWLIRLGSLLLLCVPPLEEFSQARDWALMGAFVKSMGTGAGISGTDVLTLQLPLTYWSALYLLASVIPSVLATMRGESALSRRLTLLWFAPVFVFACVASHRSVAQSSKVLQPWVKLSPILSAGLLAGAALLLPLFHGSGTSPSRRASFARVLLIVAVGWLVLLDWNGWRLPLTHLAGWAGLIGAALVILGELRRDS